MMQPMDTLSQLAMCCSSGCKRRDYNKPPRNYFYSPNSALIDPNSGWPLTHNPHHYGHHPHQPPPPSQPYFLLTQPVIIASNSASNPTNTITLVQHAQSTPNAGNFPNLSILGTSTASPAGLQQSQQPNVVTSQYAIYQSPAALNNSIMGSAQATTIYENHQQAGLNRNLSTYILSKSPMLPIMEAVPSPSIHTHLNQQLHHHHQQQQQPVQQQLQPQQVQRKPATLNSELFRQLEVIEKQVDLSKEMELVERHGIVTNRALDPYSLMPHLTETTLRKYNEHFLFNDDSVIRFIEIIKRPGQTLGLYIRTVHFEDPRTLRGTRTGLVVTKIDSDSPIYNSQVLHVGDEILSVNLVDIQGMSLDDVVIIMSMPKRLVLALRIPRERDCLFTANLLQQQQMFRNLLKQRENSILAYPLAQQQQQFEVDQSLMVEQGLRSASSLGGGGVGGCSQRPVLQRPSMQFNESYIEQRERQFHQSRPGSLKTGDQHFGDLSRTWEEEDDAAGNINNIRDYGLISGSNINDRNILIKERASIPEGGRFSKSLLYTSSIGIGGTGVNTSTNNHETILNSNNNHESTDVVSTTPSTLPRRTLPTRPTLVSSSQPGTMVKQPVISNLRLGDTPEQSSYFSSSIDAINRELKELRRQRMALSNNEQSVDSSTGVGLSRETGYLASCPTDMSWSDNWTLRNAPEMKLHSVISSAPSTQPGS